MFFTQLTVLLHLNSSRRVTALFTTIFPCMFPGTASVALAGLLAAQRAIGKPITEHRVLFLGAGEVK